MNRKERRRAAKLNRDDQMEVHVRLGRIAIPGDFAPYCQACGNAAQAWEYEGSRSAHGVVALESTEAEEEDAFIICRACFENEGDTIEALMRKRFPGVAITPANPEAAMKIEKNEAGDDVDLFIIFNGRKIAKRGKPGTSQAKTWVPLEPGYRVLDGKDRPDGGGSLIIENFGAELQ